MQRRTEADPGFGLRCEQRSTRGSAIGTGLIFVLAREPGGRCVHPLRQAAGFRLESDQPAGEHADPVDQRLVTGQRRIQVRKAGEAVVVGRGAAQVESQHEATQQARERQPARCSEKRVDAGSVQSGVGQAAR